MVTRVREILCSVREGFLIHSVDSIKKKAADGLNSHSVKVLDGMQLLRHAAIYCIAKIKKN